jgi:hypothetical protein
MSAECDECGFDLVGSQYDERGLWCVPCDYKRQLAEAQKRGDGYKALAERRRKALPDPDKLRLLADWFDGDDAAKGRRGPSLATLGGQPPDEVQRELRGWADDIEAAIDATPAEASEKARKFQAEQKARP